MGQTGRRSIATHILAVKIALGRLHFHGFGVARLGSWVTWVNTPREEEARFGERLKGNVCNEVGGVKRSADPRVGYETSDRTVKRARSTTSTTPDRNPEKEAKEDGHEDVRRLRDQAGGRHSEAGFFPGKAEGFGPLRESPPR